MLFEPATIWALPRKAGAIAAIPWTAPGFASASASSSMSVWDCTLAGCGPRCCWPGKTVSRLLPMFAIRPVIAAWAPLPIASSATTEATPMMMPSIVRTVRSLFARRLVTAIRTLSQMPRPTMLRRLWRGMPIAGSFLIRSINASRRTANGPILGSQFTQRIPGSPRKHPVLGLPSATKEPAAGLAWLGQHHNVAKLESRNHLGVRVADQAGLDRYGDRLLAALDAHMRTGISLDDGAIRHQQRVGAPVGNNRNRRAQARAQRLISLLERHARQVGGYVLLDGRRRRDVAQRPGKFLARQCVELDLCVLTDFEPRQVGFADVHVHVERRVI